MSVVLPLVCTKESYSTGKAHGEGAKTIYDVTASLESLN